MPSKTDSKLYKRLMERCRKIRRESDLTVRSLAQKLEVTEGYVSSLENGRATPSAKLLMRYIESLGINHDQLIDSLQKSGPHQNPRQALVANAVKLLEQIHDEESLLLAIEMLTAIKSFNKPVRKKAKKA